MFLCGLLFTVSQPARISFISLGFSMSEEDNVALGEGCWRESTVVGRCRLTEVGVEQSTIVIIEFIFAYISFFSYCACFFLRVVLSLVGTSAQLL